MQPLNHLSAISIVGPDALAFCQSQVTSDLAGLSPEKWHPSAWCDAKGQVIVVMLVRVGECVVELIMPASQVTGVASAMSRYTIGRQVSISRHQAVFGDWRPQGDHEHPRLACDPSRVLFVEKSLPQKPDDAKFLAEWRLADLKAGLAWLCPKLSMRFLPQSLGLERLFGLSYRKGCYPGQEVIAKIHYRGQLKHRLVLLAQVPDEIKLSPNTDLYHWQNPNQSGGARACGVIIDQVADHALAVVRSTVRPGERLYADAPEPSNQRLFAGEVVDLPSEQNRTPVS